MLSSPSSHGREWRGGVSLALLLLALLPGTVAARTEIAPYIEADQTLIANIKGDDGILTYTTLAVGVDGSVTSRRAEAQVSLRYEHQFGWNRRTPDQDIISGIARARYWVISDTLNLEGSAFATRLRSDGLYGAGGLLANRGKSTDDIYAFTVGPTLTTHIDDLMVNAAYRFGYTKVDGHSDFGVGDNRFRYGSFDESTYHSLTGSVGMRPGDLPFGWTLSAGYDRENASELKQRYSDLWVRGDVTVPVSPTLALVGGVGYEKMKISQQSVLIDEDGAPVVDGNGNYVGDPSAPRLLAYDTDGIIWDAGVLWRPSRRTSLELRVGRRYDSMHYTGTLNWQAGPNSSVQVTYFDTIDSFGRGLNNGLATLPFAFDALRNPFTGLPTGCVSGEDGLNCLNDTLAGISAANYRRRGVTGQYSYARGRWNWGLGLGWTQRKFLAPDVGILATIDGLKDNSYYGVLFGGMQLDQMSSVNGSVYVNHMDAGGSDLSFTNYGGYVTYARQFGRRLSGQASVGVDAVDGSQVEQIISLLGRIGVRYQF